MYLYLKRPVYLISIKDIADFISWFADDPCSSSAVLEDEETDDRPCCTGKRRNFTQTSEIECKIKSNSSVKKKHIFQYTVVFPR